MNRDDRERIRLAFFAAAHSPVARNRHLEGHTVTLREVLLQNAESDAQYKAIDKAIEAGETTVDEFIRQLQAAYPPRLRLV